MPCWSLRTFSSQGESSARSRYEAPLPAQGSLAPHTLPSVTSSKRCRFVIRNRHNARLVIVHSRGIRSQPIRISDYYGPLPYRVYHSHSESYSPQPGLGKGFQSESPPKSDVQYSLSKKRESVIGLRDPQPRSHGATYQVDETHLDLHEASSIMDRDNTGQLKGTDECCV